MPSAAALTGTVHVPTSQVLVRALFVGLVASALIGVPFVLRYWNEVKAAQRDALIEDRHHVELGSRITAQTLQAVVSDLRYLSDQNELKELLAEDTAPHRTRLAQEHAAFLRQKPEYDQVRWIGADGWEKARVHRTATGVEIALPNQLQNKTGRYYFDATIKLEEGQVYVSALDLNVERDRVEEPRKPTLRVAVPLFASDGRRAGILIVNFLAGPMLAELRALTPPGGSNIWLLNAEGYWLLGPGDDVEWAFMYPDRVDRSLAVREPDVWRRLSTEIQGDIDTATGLLTFERFYPLRPGRGAATRARELATSAADSYWIVAAYLPRAVLGAHARELAQQQLVAYALMAGLAFSAAAGLAYLSFRNRALSQLVSHVVDHVPALVSYVDAGERYRFVNRYYETLFGTPRSQLVSRPVREVIGEAAYAEALPRIRTALAGEPVSFEAAIEYSKAGHRDVSVTYAPDVAPGGRVRGFIAVINDITAQKAAERRERERMREVAHATRLASVGELATQIAHEVNQPITAMVTYCAAAQRNVQAESPNNTRLAGLIGAIADEAQRVSAVIRRLRDFVRKGEIAFVATDVNEIVTDSLRLVAGEAVSQQVQVVEQLATEPLRVMADPVLVSQAILNLVRNAIEAVTTSAAGRHEVRVATRRTGHAAEVSVTDTGPGLSPEVVPRLFEAFVTTKPNGLGMGLSIARSIIEAHGGQLRYSEAPGGGCTFTLTLPGIDS